MGLRFFVEKSWFVLFFFFGKKIGFVLDVYLF